MQQSATNSWRRISGGAAPSLHQVLPPQQGQYTKSYHLNKVRLNITVELPFERPLWREATSSEMATW